jgi:hypothetical protein
LLESGEISKDSVAFENPRRIDPSKTDKNWVQKCENQFARSVTIVPLFESKSRCQKSFQLQSLKEMLNKKESTEVSQVLSGKGKTQISRPKGHCTNS